ncbi:MAG: hypothetical protein QMD08_08160 [Actinomycetota bacterium]|nr:hypothetical protein [Actinomycetota bacterium]
MQRRFIVCDPAKCKGCGICELACSAAKEGVFNPLLSRIHVVDLGSNGGPISKGVSTVAIACMLCDDPICVKVCEKYGPKIISSDEEKGIVSADASYTGCDKCGGWCMKACEFGSLTLNLKKGRVVVCDNCSEEILVGEPPCVQFCPHDALSFSAIEEVVEGSESETARKILQEFSRVRRESKGVL